MFLLGTDGNRKHRSFLFTPKRACAKSNRPTKLHTQVLTSLNIYFSFVLLSDKTSASKSPYFWLLCGRTVKAKCVPQLRHSLEFVSLCILTMYGEESACMNIEHPAKTHVQVNIIIRYECTQAHTVKIFLHNRSKREFSYFD